MQDSVLISDHVTFGCSLIASIPVERGVQDQHSPTRYKRETSPAAHHAIYLTIFIFDVFPRRKSPSPQVLKTFNDIQQRTCHYSPHVYFCVSVSIWVGN